MNLFNVVKKAGEKLQWQHLGDAFVSMRRVGETPEVTFYTTHEMAQMVCFQTFGIKKPAYIGLVLWVPEESFEEGKTQEALTFDLVTHLRRQREFSERTFGPGQRTQGVLDHIRKELAEIEAQPTDLSEWIDVVLLALDGAWRHGGTPEGIAAALAEKQAANEQRQWPDWRTADPDKAICHVEEVAEEYK